MKRVSLIIAIFIVLAVFQNCAPVKLISEQAALAQEQGLASLLDGFGSGDSRQVLKAESIVHRQYCEGYPGVSCPAVIWATVLQSDIRFELLDGNRFRLVTRNCDIHDVTGTLTILGFETNFIRVRVTAGFTAVDFSNQQDCAAEARLVASVLVAADRLTLSAPDADFTLTIGDAQRSVKFNRPHSILNAYKGNYSAFVAGSTANGQAVIITRLSLKEEDGFTLDTGSCGPLEGQIDAKPTPDDTLFSVRFQAIVPPANSATLACPEDELATLKERARDIILGAIRLKVNSDRGFTLTGKNESDSLTFRRDPTVWGND